MEQLELSCDSLFFAGNNGKNLRKWEERSLMKVGNINSIGIESVISCIRLNIIFVYTAYFVPFQMIISTLFSFLFYRNKSQEVIILIILIHLTQLLVVLEAGKLVQ